MYRQLWNNNPFGIPMGGQPQPPYPSHVEATGQTLELGGMIYQYFVVGIHRPEPAMIMTNLGPMPEGGNPPMHVMLAQPMAGPFPTFQEASQFSQMLLHGEYVVVPLPVHMFARNRSGACRP